MKQITFNDYEHYVAAQKHTVAKRGWWPDDELTQLARDTSRFPRHHIRLFVARR